MIFYKKLRTNQNSQNWFMKYALSLQIWHTRNAQGNHEDLARFQNLPFLFQSDFFFVPRSRICQNPRFKNHDFVYLLNVRNTQKINNSEGFEPKMQVDQCRFIHFSTYGLRNMMFTCYGSYYSFSKPLIGSNGMKSLKSILNV